MTEPVAYLVFDNDSKRKFLRFTPSPFNDNVPLYTKEQLQPRVKMTQKQSDDFKSLHAQFDLLSDGINAIYEIEHLPMKSWIVNGKLRENEMLIAGIWGEYDPDNPEETIEIIPTMKWFVQRNDTKDRYRFLSKDIVTSDNEFNYSSLKYSAKQFDTKEEAEEWTNPLTEAAQLPVEDE